MSDAVSERGTALARCYIAYRLEREGLRCEYYKIDRALMSTELFERICALADEVEYRYVISFDDLYTESSMDSDKFDVVARELFGSGIRWGRVMALFAYVGAMAIQCKEKKQENILRQMGPWIDRLIQNQLSSWVKHQPRQWDSIVDHYRAPPYRSVHWAMKLFLALVVLCALAVFVAAVQAMD